MSKSGQNTSGNRPVNLFEVGVDVVMGSGGGNVPESEQMERGNKKGDPKKDKKRDPKKDEKSHENNEDCDDCCFQCRCDCGDDGDGGGCCDD